MSISNLKEVKTILFNRMNMLLLPLGFKYIKSQDTYAKNTINGKVEISFGFINYIPLSIDYHFIVLIYNKELQHLVSGFYSKYNLQKKGDWNLIIYEGDFIEETKRKPIKFRYNYYNSVKTLFELEVSINNTIEIVNNNMQLFNDFLDLSRFSNFFIENKDKICLNFASREFIISILVATAFINKTQFLGLIDYIEIELKRLEKLGDGYPQTQEIISLAREYFNIL